MLDLIIELAVFEREPEAVEITVEDLVRDGFSENPKFKFFVAEECLKNAVKEFGAIGIFKRTPTQQHTYFE
mgnify:CR=1 FL=1